MGYPLEAKEVIVLAPHPDDEALGCGGTLILLKRRGASITTVYLTDGERLHGEPSQSTAEKRRKEAQRASEIFGCTNPVFLDLPDGGLANCVDVAYEKLQQLIRQKEPDIVFSPSLIDYHPDHIATARVIVKVLDSLRSFRVAFYEVYSTVRFTDLVDISEVVEEKRRAISSYETSLYGIPKVFVRAALGLNAHRALFFQNSSLYEAFWIVKEGLNDKQLIDWLTYGFSVK